MDVKVSRGNLHSFRIAVPASKSISHRALIAASLHEGRSVIRHPVFNQDTEATMRCLKALGASFEIENDTVFVQGTSNFRAYEGSVLDCGESGSTLRFLIPLLAASGREAIFTGRGRLMERPQTVYEQLFDERGISFYKQDAALRLKGNLTGDRFVLNGNVSSQFISGLLFALPLLEKDSSLHIVPPYESRSYVGLTEAVLKRAGIVMEDKGLEILVPGRQRYQSLDMEVDGDDSQAAFFACLGAMAGTELHVSNMKHDSAQGDHAVLSFLKSCGAAVKEEEEGYVFSGGDLRGTEMDLGDCPDLGPVLFAAASCCKGESRFLNAGRLRLKESDRIECMRQELEKLGVRMYSDGDTVTVAGKASWQKETEVYGHNDHRIVMALSVLACREEIPLIIKGAEAVSKSYPSFFEDLASVGAEVCRI